MFTKGLRQTAKLYTSHFPVSPNTLLYTFSIFFAHPRDICMFKVHLSFKGQLKNLPPPLSLQYFSPRSGQSLLPQRSHCFLTLCFVHGYLSVWIYCHPFTMASELLEVRVCLVYFGFISNSALFSTQQKMINKHILKCRINKS